jgi:hypothetical protein
MHCTVHLRRLSKSFHNTTFTTTLLYIPLLIRLSPQVRRGNTKLWLASEYHWPIRLTEFGDSSSLLGRVVLASPPTRSSIAAGCDSGTLQVETTNGCKLAFISIGIGYQPMCFLVRYIVWGSFITQECIIETTEGIYFLPRAILYSTSRTSNHSNDRSRSSDINPHYQC